MSDLGVITLAIPKDYKKAIALSLTLREHVILTAAEAAPGIISPEEGRLCSVDDVEAITQVIIELCSMSNAKWKSLSDASLRKASLHSWSKATDKFERALEQLQ